MVKLYENRIVVKIEYTSFEYQWEKNCINYLNSLIPFFVDMENMGYEIILLFCEKETFSIMEIKGKDKNKEILNKKSLSLIKQNKLIYFCNKEFLHYGKYMGQFILRKEELLIEKLQKNLLETIEFLLKKKIIILVAKNPLEKHEKIWHYEMEDDFSYVITRLLKAKKFIILSNYEDIQEKSIICEEIKLFNWFKMSQVESYIIGRKNISQLIKILKK